MTAKPHPLSACLGLDIGRVHTRASYFGISEGKYRLMGSEMAVTSLGHGLHLGSGLGAAMKGLEKVSNSKILTSAGELIKPVDNAGHGVDQVALMVSGGPRVSCALLGLTAKGSLSAGQAVLDGLPVKDVQSLGIDALLDENSVIEVLLENQPQIILITGGEDAGAQKPLQKWVEVVRLVSSLLPAPVKPQVVFCGNPCLETDVRRRLEPVASLKMAPNLRPVSGECDFVPAQTLLDETIMQIWKVKMPGLVDLAHLAKGLEGTKWFALDRMVRFLSWQKSLNRKDAKNQGVLAVDLGGGSTTVVAGLDGKVGRMVQPCWGDMMDVSGELAARAVHQWVMSSTPVQAVHQHLCHHAMIPGLVPENIHTLTISQALACLRLQAATARLSANYPWVEGFGEKGMVGRYDPIIASGSVLTRVSTPGQALFLLLNGLQPWGVTNMLLDRNHILALLGLIGEKDPLLAVQVLESGVFENLAPVISPVSDALQGETILTVRVTTASGEDYVLDIVQGTLRRLLIPVGTSVELRFMPKLHTNIGLGDRDGGGRINVIAGILGVVIDARGRPLKLADQDGVRVEQLRKWLWSLGG